MKKLRFGKTQLEISPLGFGGASIGYLKTEQQRVTRVLNLLLDSGVNVIDTAACYEGSEELIGSAVSHRRQEYVLVSKCGHSVPESDEPEWSAGLVQATVERALRRLKTEYLDVMLLHTCERDVLERGDVIGALSRAQQAGKVRYYGFSGDNETAAYAASLEGISVVEISVNLVDQRNIDVVLPETRRHDLGVLVKRPVANTAWKDPSQQRGILREYSSTYHQRLKQLNLDPAMLGIDGPAAQAWMELAFRFTLAQHGVHCAIIGTTDTKHAEANLEIVRKGPLPAESVATIRTAFREADPTGAWLGQT